MASSGTERTYQRDDIYYCECCGLFHSSETDQPVDVPLHELPADFALLVMQHRQTITNPRHRTVTRRRRPKQRKGNGFGRGIN